MKGSASKRPAKTKQLKKTIDKKKHNQLKQPNAFNGGHVLHQLRCSGMMEALRLMHAGFPTRCPYEDLYDRYKDMMPRSIASLDSPSFCEILLMALGLDKADYQLGITKVFFRALSLIHI